MTSDTEPPVDTAASTGAPQAAAPAAEGAAPARKRRSRGGQGGGARAAAGDAAAAQQQQPPQPQAAKAEKAEKSPRVPHPALNRLAELYPRLFGAHFLPLKRGIFEDLLAAHPDAFERDALKAALGLHARSTRYLQVVAEGRKRHDLAGNPVEALAPEHVHHASVELWRRRVGRTPEAERDALRAQVLRRIVRNVEASGLARDAYAERVATRDAAVTALVDEALAEVAVRAAKDEAVLRALDASGQSPEAFADMYGLDVRTVRQALERAGKRAPAAETAAQ
ncbi:ProQ/FINO family protein [Xylophilus sp.]|uniref:ProQ/FINO family protein n=1 Tax=Xylophilus sp. TaxID=2653893 RepID=UPI0013BD413F|nr:ProQ/FINO family protein [Xylophilus sp.]KAF1050296.1 MAG: RNA chaperone ProQ [Xylophilus sp.]